MRYLDSSTGRLERLREVNVVWKGILRSLDSVGRRTEIEGLRTQ